MATWAVIGLAVAIVILVIAFVGALAYLVAIGRGMSR